MMLGHPVDPAIPKERSSVRLGDPASALRSPTLAELGLLVTICIAAQSRDNCFVAVADRLLSLSTPDEYLPGAENATAKAFDIGFGWYALGAGDIGLAKSIVIGAQQILYEMNPQPAGLAMRAQIGRAFRGAYRRVLKERIEGELLNPYGLSWRQFHKGLASGLHAEIDERIRNYNLGVGLLVFGMDANRFQHLLHVHDPGVIEDRIYVGHWAIGSGANAALGTLAVRLTERLLHAELIYRLCEAKFSCEGVDGIGRMTNVLVQNPLGELTQLHPQYIDQLRVIWERERRTPAPPDAMEVIAEALRYRLP